MTCGCNTGSIYGSIIDSSHGGRTSYAAADVIRRGDLDAASSPVLDGTPVSLEEMWYQLRLVATRPPPGFSHPEDDLIMEYVAAVTSALEGVTGWLGRALTPQHWTVYLSTLSGRDKVLLPFPPLRSVAGVTYTDADGVTQTLDPSAYTVTAATSAKDASVGFIKRVTDTQWPDMKTMERGVAVTFVAGYAEDECDRLIKAYIRMAAATMYENRESVIIAPGALPYELPGWQGMLENKRVRGMIV